MYKKYSNFCRNFNSNWECFWTPFMCTWRKQFWPNWVICGVIWVLFTPYCSSIYHISQRRHWWYWHCWEFCWDMQQESCWCWMYNIWYDPELNPGQLKPQCLTNLFSHETRNLPRFLENQTMSPDNVFWIKTGKCCFVKDWNIFLQLFCTLFSTQSNKCS